MELLNLFEELTGEDFKKAVKSVIENHFTQYTDLRHSYKTIIDGVESDRGIVDDVHKIVLIHLVRDNYARSIVLKEFETLTKAQQSQIHNYTCYFAKWSNIFIADEAIALLKLHTVLHDDLDYKSLERIMKKAFSKLLRIADGFKIISLETFEKAYKKYSTDLHIEFSIALFYRYLKGKYEVEINDHFINNYHHNIYELANSLYAPLDLLINNLEGVELELGPKDVFEYANELERWGLMLGFNDLPESIDADKLLTVMNTNLVLFKDPELLKRYFDGVQIHYKDLLSLYTLFKSSNVAADITAFTAYLYSYMYERYHLEQQELLFNQLSIFGNFVDTRKQEDKINQVIASREGVISNLESKLSRNEKIHNDRLTEAANEYQALERKYRELEKKIEDTSNLKRELLIHRNSLYEQFIEMDITDTLPVDTTDYVTLLKKMDLKMVLFGGFPSFRQKWKEAFGDNVRIVGSRDYYVNLKFINNVDVIIFDGKCNNHSLFENVMEALESDEPIFKLLRNKRSMQLICKDIYEKLTKE